MPSFDLPDEPTAWDVYSSVGVGSGTATDNVRPADGEVIEVEQLPWITVFDPQAGQ